LEKTDKNRSSKCIFPRIGSVFNDEVLYYNPFDIDLKYNYYVKKSDDNDGYLFCHEKSKNEKCLFKVYFKEHIPSGALLLSENITNLSGQTILDLGSGTGIISIFAGMRNAQKAVAIEINSKCIEIAKYNFNLNNLDNCAEVLEGNMFDPIKGHKFDKIITNPPQMPTPKNNCDDQDYGGPYGSDFLDRMINTANNYLTPHGEIWIFLMEFLGITTRYGGYPTLFEKLEDSGFKPEIVASASRIVRRGGATEKMIPYILSIYPLYEFYDDSGNYYNGQKIIKDELKNGTNMYYGVKVVKCVLK